MNVREVYIDLEMTVIDNFQNARLINIDKLKKLIRMEKDRMNLRIFSFAIFNHAHRQDFLVRVAPKIEEALDATIVEVVTIEEMMQADLRYSGVHFNTEDGCDVSDWLSIRGKLDGFRNYVLEKGHKYAEYILIDDVVPNLKLHNSDDGVSIHYVNVDRFSVMDQIRIGNGRYYSYQR